MNQLIKLSAGIFLLCTVSSCTTIPKNASLLSVKVTEGIQRIQVENEKMVNSMGDVERAILDDNWDDLFTKTETLYMQKAGISDGSKLTHDDRRKIATNAAKIREDILKEIEMKVQDLISKSRENATQVIAINEEVRKYLVSLQNLKETEDNLSKLIKDTTHLDLSGLEGSVKEFIEKRMK